MNPKIRALLWEELRVGGAIAGVVTLAGVVAQLSLLGHADLGRARSVDPLVLTTTLGFALAAVLLLTLNTANSGHLTGGFSRRILRLPVETWSTVLVIFLSRLLAVLAVTALLVGTSWGLLGQGPGAHAILILGMVYLLVQVLDWLRGVAPSLILMLAGLLLVLTLVNLNRIADFAAVIAGPAGLTRGLALVFVPCTAFAYAIALIAVRRTRRGVRVALPGLPHALTAPRASLSEATLKPFASPLAAQIWFERRRAGSFLALATLGLWIAGLGLRWLLVHDARGNPSWGYLGYPYVLDPLWLFEIFPYLALLGAAALWGVTLGWRRSRRKDERPSAFLLRLPIEPLDQVRALYRVAGLQLARLLLPIAAISTVALLWNGDKAMLHLFAGALERSETSWKEILSILLGPPLLLGLICWTAITVPLSRNVYLRWVLFFAALLSILITLWIALDGLLGVSWVFRQYYEAGSWAYVLYGLLPLPILGLGWSGIQARRRRLLPWWSLASIILIWIAILLAVFPYGSYEARRHFAAIVLTCACFAAVPVLPFVLLLRDCVRRPYTDGSARGISGLDRSTSGWGYTPRRAGGLALLLSLFLAIAWVRYLPEAPYKAAWRARGLPTNRDEFDAQRPNISADNNLALLYLHASDLRKRLETDWLDRSGGPSKGGASLDLFNPSPNQRFTETMTDENWEAGKVYWDEVGKAVAQELHAAAKSGLAQSRYPVDLQSDWPLVHAQSDALQRLCLILELEALIAARERRPADAVEAVLDIFPLAHSLVHDGMPGLQMQGIREYSDAMVSLQGVLRYAAFDEESLTTLAAGLRHALPPPGETWLADRSSLFNTLVAIDVVENSRFLDFIYRDSSFYEDNPPRRLLANVLTAGHYLLGWPLAGRMIAVDSYAESRSAHSKALLEGYSHPLRSQGMGWSEVRSKRSLQFHSGLSSFAILLYTNFYYEDAESALRIHYNLARVAVAVERYRLAHGQLPDNLGQLVPQYLTSVPGDPFKRPAPLSYRAKDEGGYVVYSVGPDRLDDGGVQNTSILPPPGTTGSSRRADDIAFIVQPAEARH